VSSDARAAARSASRLDQSSGGSGESPKLCALPLAKGFHGQGDAPPVIDDPQPLGPYPLPLAEEGKIAGEYLHQQLPIFGRPLS
jgi:hypothetical protein